MSILNTLLGLFGLIPSVLILVASIIILSRTKHAGAILMVIGQSFSLLMSIYYALLWPILVRSELVGSQLGIASSITHTLSVFASIIFGAGLFILALGFLNKK